MGYMSDWNDRIYQHVGDKVRELLDGLRDDEDQGAEDYQLRVGAIALMTGAVCNAMDRGWDRETVISHVNDLFDDRDRRNAPKPALSSGPGWLRERNAPQEKAG